MEKEFMTKKYDAILDAAQAAFNEKGVDGVGLREIARLANVAQPTVNYHFETKEKLVAAVIECGSPATNASRLEKLSELTARYPTPSLEVIVRVIFEPYNQPHDRGSAGERAFIKFIAKTAAAGSQEAKRAILQAYDAMPAEFVSEILATAEGFERLSAAPAYLCA